MSFLFVILVFSTTLTAAVVVSEDTIVDHLDHAPTLMSLKERLISSKELQGSLKRSFLPEVKVLYGTETFTTGPYHSETQPFGGVEAELNVFNSGKDVLADKISNKKAEILQLDLEISRAQILTEIRMGLAHFAYLSETLAIVKEAIRLNSQNIQGARKRIAAGLSTSTDILDFNQEKITLNQKLESIKYDQGVVQRLLAVLLGLDPHTELEIQHSNQHPEHGGESELGIKAEGSKITEKANLFSTIAKLESEAADRWWGPKLELYSYALRFTQKEREFEDSQERNDFTYGFRFTFPIFDGGDGFQESASRRSLARSNEYQLRKKSLEVEKKTLDALKKLELAHTLIHGAEESVELMNQYRLKVIQEYNKGVKNSPDVLQATQRWIDAKYKFAEVKKSYQAAKAEALYLKGLNR